MTPNAPSDSETIKCRTTADFLAALPLLVGFSATNSIFIVLFHEAFAGHTIRIDLPPDDSPGSSMPVLDFISDTLTRLSKFAPPSPAIVITTDQSFPRQGPAPWHRFARRLERRLRRDGFAPRELCCLAANAWVGFFDPEPPPGGRPLAEIEASPVARAHRKERRKIPDLSQLGVIPSPDPRRAAAVRACLDKLPPFTTPVPAAGAAFGLHHADDRGTRGEDSGWLLEVAQLCDTVWSTTTRLTPAHTATLIRTAAHPDRWLVLTMGLLTGPDAPLDLATDGAPDSFVGVPLGLSEGTAAPPVHDRPEHNWSVRQILMGLSTVFEEYEHLPPLLDVLLTAISEAPVELRPNLLALSAWLWWLRGSQTVAERQLREAFAIDGEHPLSRMIERLVESTGYARLICDHRVAA